MQQGPKMEPSLGKWASNQRELKKKGKLDQKREAKLVNIGFDFNVRHHAVHLNDEHNDMAWEQKYQALLEFKEQFGHCKVPESNPLYSWVIYQRVRQKDNLLKAERKDRLNKIGFTWMK
jgi:hypothetical protein